TDVYRFGAGFFYRVCRDTQARSGWSTAMCSALDPFDNVVFKNFFADVGPTTLRAAGTYTVLVEGSRFDAANPGSYTLNVQPVSRSEERRVGKEWRSGGTAEQVEKNERTVGDAYGG